jgi:hypothetical protein
MKPPLMRKYRLILVRIFFSSLELTADNAEAINPFPFCPNISLNLDLILSEFKKRGQSFYSRLYRYLRVCFCYFILLLQVLLFQLRLYFLMLFSSDSKAFIICLPRSFSFLVYNYFNRFAIIVVSICFSISS